MCYILLTGVAPFYASSDLLILQQITQSEPNYNLPCLEENNVSQEALSFLKSCLEKNPKNRLSAKEALHHVWFSAFFKRPFESKILLDETVTSMRAFIHKPNLTQIFLKILSHTCTSDQIQVYKEEFAKFNHTEFSGEISERTFTYILLCNEVSLDESHIIYSRLNLENPSRGVRYHEFVTAVLEESVLTEVNYLLGYDMLTHNQTFFSKLSVLELLGESYIPSSAPTSCNVRVCVPGVDALGKDLDALFTSAGLSPSLPYTYEDVRALCSYY